VHRGSFFQTLRTTTVRKLLPESWGFICPVHTPDGAPCGLLNHLSHKCKITTSAQDVSGLPELITSLGVTPARTIPSAQQVSSVQLDGRIIGHCTDALAHHVSQVLRLWKVSGQYDVPLDLEIGYIPTSNGGQYPGLYLFSTQARMKRPVKHLATEKEDWVGPFEQVYMSIAVKPVEVSPESTHMEFHPTNILSIVANLTPFSDFNPSPRNMYQCQMGKQTMGTAGTAVQYRTDNKMYRLQTGQTPIVRPKLYEDYGLDHFPMGTNAIVAVISYTGYDMDDAVILNKAAHERGFAYGTIYKTEVVDLKEKRKLGEKNILFHFGFGPQTSPSMMDRLRDKIDDDGFPFIGSLLLEGDPLCVYWDELSGRTLVESYHGPEDAFVDEVRVLGTSLLRPF
jgi:DNA-directed RNA polymerase I subunit RPA2